MKHNTNMLLLGSITIIFFFPNFYSSRDETISEKSNIKEEGKNDSDCHFLQTVVNNYYNLMGNVRTLTCFSAPVLYKLGQYKILYGGLIYFPRFDQAAEHVS